MRETECIRERPKVINIGIELFAQALKDQGVDVIHVDWRPPAGGDFKSVKLLEQMLSKR
jgi:uncharacterized UPF0146 family protein